MIWLGMTAAHANEGIHGDIPNLIVCRRVVQDYDWSKEGVERNKGVLDA